MLTMLVVNMVFLAYVLAASFIIAGIIKVNTGAAMIAAVICIAGGMILVFAYGSSAAEIADFGTPGIKDFFCAVPAAAKDGFLFGLISGGLLMAGIIGIPGYISMGNMVGLTLGVFLFWLEVIAALSFQWFLPVRSLLHNNFGKCMKKSFILFFDNPGFSLFIGIYSLFLGIISVFLFFLLPSAAGIELAHVNALRLRMYKYDWLEKHPELKTRAEQKNIPWDDLLQNDKDTLGPRKFKSFIFPWKD